MIKNQTHHPADFCTCCKTISNHSLKQTSHVQHHVTRSITPSHQLTKNQDRQTSPDPPQRALPHEAGNTGFDATECTLPDQETHSTLVPGLAEQPDTRRDATAHTLTEDALSPIYEKTPVPRTPTRRPPKHTRRINTHMPRTKNAINIGPLYGRFPPEVHAQAEQLNILLAASCTNGSCAPKTINNTYHEFRNCNSLQDVIATAIEIAPTEFDMAAAITACEQNTVQLDSTRISDDLHYAEEHGIKALLQSARHRTQDNTLQPDVVTKHHRQASSFEYLSSLANEGVDTSTTVHFNPNMGQNCPTYPAHISNERVKLHSLQKQIARGRIILLPAQKAIELASRDGIPIHFSPSFSVRKPDKPTGRFVVNYSHDGPNDPSKHDTLKDRYGPIRPPQYAKICTLLENATKAFPDKPLTALRRDIDAAFNRLHYTPRASTLCAFPLTIDGTKYACLPLVGQMGDQDVNTAFDQVTRAVDEALTAFSSRVTGQTLPLTAVATDDCIAVGSEDFIDAAYDFLGSLVGDASHVGLLGKDALATDKDLRGSIIDILGWSFDCGKKVVKPNAATFAKLIVSFFATVGPDPKPGKAIKLRQLQRMAAHAVRAADVITAMLPYSRSFHRATAGLSDPDAPAYLTTACIHDIYMWRTILIQALQDTTLLETPTFAPPLRQRLYPDETITQREQRALEHADIVAYSDASKGSSGPPGIGGFVPDYGWFSEQTPNLTSVTDSKGYSREADINIHEFLALVTTAALAIEALKARRTPLKGAHIHILCDNTSSVARARNQRANLPIYSALLSTFSMMQVRTGALITVGYIKGELNVTADAASRNFNVLNGQQILDRLLPLTRRHVGKEFMMFIDHAAANSMNIDLAPVRSPLMHQA